MLIYLAGSESIFHLFIASPAIGIPADKRTFPTFFFQPNQSRMLFHKKLNSLKR